MSSILEELGLNILDWTGWGKK